MKYEAVAQFTVTGSSKVNGAINLLNRYGIDYVILDQSTGILSPKSCEIVILKPEPAKLTPDKVFSFMMKFDEMVRIGKESHTLTPAQIDLAKSCDKAKLLSFLNDTWYRVKVSYVKIIAMLAQAYAIADNKPDLDPGEKNDASDSGCPVVDAAFAKLSELNDMFPKELLDELLSGNRATTTDQNEKGENKS